jgi:hypothetical protein
MRHNMLSFMSAEAMAAAFGGDPSYIPARIGFIYGDKDDMVMPPITRDQDWDGLLEELSSRSDNSTVDVQVVGFSYPPTLGGEEQAQAPSDSSDSGSGSGSDSGSDSRESDYDHIRPGGANAITFHAVSNSQDSGAAFGNEPFVAGNYIYHAVLLGYDYGKYYVLSRVSLEKDGAYLRKPSGFEVALDWTVVFN